jgi:hypothetical protein
MKQLCFLSLVVCFAIAGLGRDAYAEETGRWKLGTGGCYFDPADDGPDQCSSSSGRYKYDSGTCYWDANDSGPNQCTPSQPPLLTDPQDQIIADAAHDIYSLGVTGAPTDLNPVIAVLKEHGITNMTIQGQGPYHHSPPDDAYGLWSWAMYGDTPTCTDKETALIGMQAVDYALKAGQAAFGYLNMNVQNMPGSPQKAALQTELGVVQYVHDALKTVSGDMLEAAQNKPCLDQ